MSLSDTTTVIGIGYRARNGKDTVADVMVKKFSKLYDVRKYSFGSFVKQEVNAMDQFAACLNAGIQYDTAPDMKDPLCQTKHGKQGRLLQFWGEERRKQDKFYWIKKLDAVVKKEKPQFAIIPDLRHKAELLWVKAHKGHSVKVTRTGFVDLSRDPNHVSEVDLDGVEFDYEIIVPEGQTAQLKSDAIEVFNLIVEKITPRVDDIEELNRGV